MAYSPGQPWDKTLSYTLGQSCTYNGLPYVFWRPDAPSTVGVEPNKEEAPFFAVDPVTGATDSRNERCWVLADYTLADGLVRYGSIRRLQTRIRGVGGTEINYGTSFPYEYAEYYGECYHGYWSPYPGQRSSSTWKFYGQMYGQSLELGLPNTTPGAEAPVYDGNGNLVIGPNYDFVGEFGDMAYGGTIPMLKTLPPDPPPPTPTPPRTIYIDVIFWIGGLTDLSTQNAFGRTANYTITVDDYDNSTYPATKNTYYIHGSASTGEQRDRYNDYDTYTRSHHVITWAVNHTVAWQIKIDSITPRFDA